MSNPMQTIIEWKPIAEMPERQEEALIWWFDHDIFLANRSRHLDWWIKASGCTIDLSNALYYADVPAKPEPPMSAEELYAERLHKMEEDQLIRNMISVAYELGRTWRNEQPRDGHPDWDKITAMQKDMQRRREAEK